jgi:hypothetical protein
MTEEEWLICTEQRKLLEHLRGKASQRRFALFILDCAYRSWDVLQNDAHRLYRTIDAFIEGVIRRKRLDTVYREYTGDEMERVPAWDELAVWDSKAFSQIAHNREAEVRAQLAMIHDIFGNPFRSVAFDPAWRTTDVVLLATGIYEEKAFDRMPILADALQDAGCDSDALLAHLRDAKQTHVRGCWALDLVLGKE